MKLCILDAVTLGSDIDISVFEKFGQVSVYEATRPEEVVERISDQDVIITNKVLLNESNLSLAPNIKLICITATGTNNVDLSYTKSRGIVVTNVAGYSTNSVAQHTFAMLFYLLEHLNYYDRYVKSHEYSRSGVFTKLEKPFMELNGKIWGIIGLGNIGKSVAAIAKAFGCCVIYYSTSGVNNYSGYERVELDELLAASDVISVHAPLNPETKNLITYAHISRMKKHAILLNLGRGGIINEYDLARALNDDLIAGAGLDVLENEPAREDHPLLEIRDESKLLITPHIAWTSIEARTLLIQEVKQNIEAFLKGESRNRVC